MSLKLGGKQLFLTHYKCSRIHIFYVISLSLSPYIYTLTHTVIYLFERQICETSFFYVTFCSLTCYFLRSPSASPQLLNYHLMLQGKQAKMLHKRDTIEPPFSMGMDCEPHLHFSKSHWPIFLGHESVVTCWYHTSQSMITELDPWLID